MSSADAEISADGLYRYRLRRGVFGAQLDLPGARTMLWIMLNPSTADALKDDPTIRRVAGFTARASCPQFEVVNLFAWRSPSPKALWEHALDDGDIIGPQNDARIEDACERATAVVCAWGQRPKMRSAEKLFEHRVIRVVNMVLDARRPMLALGFNKASKLGVREPKHPLYVPRDQKFVSYEVV